MSSEKSFPARILPKLRKYLAVYTQSMSEAFVYRASFLLWRLRQILVFLVPFFVWNSLLQSGGSIYGYDLEEILTYLFGVTILRSLVFGSRTIDLAGIIRNGDLSLYLLRPVSIPLYWFIRDIADKLYNLSFILIEIPLILLLFRPPVFLQTNPTFIIETIVLVLLAVVIYFYLNYLFGMVGFWSRDVWAPRFMLMVVLEFTTGALIPIDMLPAAWQKFFLMTPFPYLTFVPLKTYLGENPQFFRSFAVMVFWIVVFRLATKKVWNKGVLNYEAEGR